MRNPTLYRLGVKTGNDLSETVSAVLFLFVQLQQTTSKTEKNAINFMGLKVWEKVQFLFKKILFYFCSMKYALLLGMFLLVSCQQGKKYHDQEKKIQQEIPDKLKAILDYQQEQNESFRDPEHSPLPDRYRKDFEALAFFPADTSYVIKAQFKRTPDAEPFLMPSTTDRQTREVVYGIASFNLNGQRFELEVYQGLDLMKEEGFEDYLFLPFLDLTNGEETYGGGRYLDLRIPDTDHLIIDFNKAYNPLCVYNKKYSCPLVPRQNFMNTKVLAGVKDFKLPN